MKSLTTKQEILEYAIETGSSFFRKEAMKAWRTILYDNLVFPMPKLQATLFISSDIWDRLKDGTWVKARRYTVRKIMWKEGSVETIGEPGIFKDKLSAMILVVEYLCSTISK